MKAILSYFIIIIITLTSLSAQENSSSKLDSLYKLDFSVPDIPAMKALGIENSTILRPTTPNELGVQLSKFFDGTNISLPSAFAIEFAPILLAKKNNKSLSEYQNTIFDNVRVSIGSYKDTSNNSSNFAIGIRWTYNFGFNDILGDYLAKRAKIRSDYQDQYASLKNTSVSKNLKEANEYADSKMKDTLKDIIDNSWNAPKLDIAISSLYNSLDSTGKGTKFKSFQSWVTYATHFGSWDQLLVGLSVKAYNNDSTNKTLCDYGLGARCYLGKNSLKAFLEARYDNKKIDLIKQSMLLNLGFEISITDNTWIVYNIGLEKDAETKTSQFKTNLDLKYNVAELINLLSK